MPASLLSRAAAASSLSAAAAARPAASRIAAVASHLRMSSSSAAPPAPGSPPPKMPSFDLSPVPKNPLGEGNYVTSAGCIIIGDEVLNGKTKDTNSNYFAKWCFNLGIELKRVEVIADDEDEIVEAVRRMASKYELVMTSGGIGPTPDDITYQSIAKAFGNGDLEYHDETLRRMQENLKARRRDATEQTEDMLTARKRMALFPATHAEVIFPTKELWVPVVRMNGRVIILPGVPRLCEALIDGMEKYTPIDPNRPRPYRLLVHTKWPESNISPFLVKLTERCKAEGIKVGSYPKWNNGVDVSLIGNDLERLQELGREVEKEVEGTITSQGKIGEESGKD